jgi:AcrR family transcriptional regulator
LKTRVHNHEGAMKETATTQRRSRLNPEVRRKQIVNTAFDVVGARGFEGLRTRDVAALAGINSATLHHHFPTKEDLIAGIAAELAVRFRAERRSDDNRKSERSGGAALADQFTDVAYYHRERPQMLAVYRELVSRTPRDSVTATLVKKLHDEWRVGLVEIFHRGRKDGSLRGDLDPRGAADLVLRAIQGLVTSADVSTSEIKRSLRALEKCLAPVREVPAGMDRDLSQRGRR